MVGLVLLVSKFISVIDFIEKYDLNISSIYVQKGKKIIPESVFKKISERKLLVDESFFTRRLDFRRRLWLESHNNYFFLTKHITAWKLAKILNRVDSSLSVDSWNVFMSSRLFATLPTSITSFRTTEVLYKFYRYTRWIIRGLFIKYGRYVPDRKKIIARVLDNY
jgi:hypothetical protein